MEDGAQFTILKGLFLKSSSLCFLRVKMWQIVINIILNNNDNKKTWGKNVLKLYVSISVSKKMGKKLL